MLLITCAHILLNELHCKGKGSFLQYIMSICILMINMSLESLPYGKSYLLIFGSNSKLLLSREETC